MPMRILGLALPVLCAAAAITVAPTASALPGYQACPAPEGHLVEVGGAATCVEASAAVEGYDWGGERVQFIGRFDCYSAPADVRPIVLICADGDDEVVMSQT